MSAAKKQNVLHLVKDGRDILCLSVAAAWALLPVLPFLLRVAVRCEWNALRLRLRGEKCAVCRVPFSRKHVFRLHREAGWVCEECHSLFDDASRALHRAWLVHAGIAPPEESAA